MSRPSRHHCHCGSVRHVSNSGHNCSRRVSRSVAATQENAAELSKFFGKLKHRETARKFNRAVRAGDACAIERLLGRHCKVRAFFKKDHFDCVKIECVAGRHAENVTTVVICVRKLRRRRS
ncbi:hypothetical protein ACFSTH_02715 [Paenibacillus yanchengensis]|uniref:Uncharacterized protein n=1 Tax=Paenibacillus yanchengensis TaxID=2035833 RepID=A0ABW4YGC1_9BACL